MDNLDADNQQPLAQQEANEPVNKVLVARLVIAALIIAIFVIFAIQNTESATIDFLTWSFQLSQFLMMILSAVAGVAIWELAGAYSKRAKNRRS